MEVENPRKLHPAALFVMGVGESFLLGVFSIVMVIANLDAILMITGSSFWLPLGFVIAAISAFPLYNIARRKWLLLGGNVTGVFLLPPTYMVIVWVMLSYAYGNGQLP